MTSWLEKGKARRSRGQALVELLILLPVLFLLFLGTAEIARLFAISGKTEAATRYLALRHFRNVPFQPTADNSYVDAIGSDEAEQVRRIFFEGALGTPDAEIDPEPYGSGEFDYSPPGTGNVLWDVAMFLDDVNDSLFGVRAHRVSFSYGLPFFPFAWKNIPGMWTGSEGDTLGPLAAAGDFAVVTDTFSSLEMMTFLQLLEIQVYFEAGTIGAAVGFIGLFFWLALFF